HAHVESTVQLHVEADHPFLAYVALGDVVVVVDGGLAADGEVAVALVVNDPVLVSTAAVGPVALAVAVICLARWVLVLFVVNLVFFATHCVFFSCFDSKKSVMW